MKKIFILIFSILIFSFLNAEDSYFKYKNTELLHTTLAGHDIYSIQQPKDYSICFYTTDAGKRFIMFSYTGQDIKSTQSDIFLIESNKKIFSLNLKYNAETKVYSARLELKDNSIFSELSNSKNVKFSTMNKNKVSYSYILSKEDIVSINNFANFYLEKYN